MKYYEITIIENVQGNTDPLSIIKEYTENIEEFIEIVQDLYKHTTKVGLKQKFTRLITKLQKQMLVDEDNEN